MTAIIITHIVMTAIFLFVLLAMICYISDMRKELVYWKALFDKTKEERDKLATKKSNIKKINN